jgi:hypothetical protein
MKLCVAGCSFSDYSQVPNVYGEYLAAKLNFEYLHEGAGCGSNYRIWRTVTNHILSGNITADDLLIIQYTEYTRNEFWSAHEYTDLPKRQTVNLVENYNNSGSLVKYKLGSASWQNHKNEQKFFESYEAEFVSPKFEEEKFTVYHEMFQHMLLNRKIPTIFLATKYWFGDQKVLAEFENTKFTCSITSENRLSDEDPNHLSVPGHQELADKLYLHIMNKGLV